MVVTRSANRTPAREPTSRQASKPVKMPKNRQAKGKQRQHQQSGAPWIEALPEELIELVNGHLNLPDIGRFRMTNRLMNSKASNGVFRSRLGPEKRLVLGDKPLSAAKEALKYPAVSGCLEHLTVASVARWSEGMRLSAEEKDQARRLTNLFGCLERNAKSDRRLRTVSITVLSRDYDGIIPLKLDGRGEIVHTRWRPGMKALAYPRKRHVWSTAAKTCLVVMTALKASKLKIERLNILTDVRGLGLAVDQIPDLEDVLAFGYIKHLAVSLSHHLDPEEDDEVEEDSRVSHKVGESNVEGVVRFLQQFQALEKLDLRWCFYATGVGRNTARRTTSRKIEEHFFDAVASDIEWPSLRSLTVDGIWTDEKHICQFLQGNPQLKSLNIKEVFLSAGEWQPVFDLLAGQNLELEHLYLNLLHAANKSTLHFAGAEDAGYRYRQRSDKEDVEPKDFSVTLRKSGRQGAGMDYHFGHGSVVGRIRGFEVVRP